MSIRVFISHSSKDKPAVEKLALALHQRGIEVWLDKWEIGPGDDIVAAINAGLEACTAGIIVFSRHSGESRWVDQELSYLIYSRIVESKALIPVILGHDCYVPPLIRPLCRVSIEDLDAIEGALRHRKGGPEPVCKPEQGRTERVLISLRRHGESGVKVEARIGEAVHGSQSHDALPKRLTDAHEAFLRGIRAGVRRDAAACERSALEASLLDLGREMGALCLPGASAEALANLLNGGGIGMMVAVCFEAEGPELLGLPIEALRLPDDRLLSTLESVVVYRRPAGVVAPRWEPLAGPLKILVAVGAPDEELANVPVLDLERELQNILDAVEPTQRHENAEIRILEVGHPEQIAGALRADAYHVLHISAHGGPGLLILEDEDGRPVDVTAEQLIGPIRDAGRPLPLVLLNACYGGVSEADTASLAEALLRAGVPAVLAMQTSVSDRYAINLARAFYAELTRREPHLASRALATARKLLEQERQAAISRGAPPWETQPEYATPSLYLAGDEKPLADFGREKQPLKVRPVYTVAGPVPQLRIDDLIGRRRELRSALRILRESERSGLVLTGIGGVGKSAIAGRVMQRLKEDGWLLAAHLGRFDLDGILQAIGSALRSSKLERLRELGREFAQPDLDDNDRFELVTRTLAEEHLLLVLDDFEQNISPTGILDSNVAVYLEQLVKNCLTGKFLITSRYPLPDLDPYLASLPVGPLSPAESRKLLLRLPGLRELGESDWILKVIGGHPRMLELLDGLMRGGEGRLPHVTRKLRELLTSLGIDPAASKGKLAESLDAALLAGAQDVLLQELLAIARDEGIAEVLLQAAVSNLPVTHRDLYSMVFVDPHEERTMALALDRLVELSLLYPVHGGQFGIHRWTAEGLRRLSDPKAYRERCIRAGEHRVWRAGESHNLAENVEAVRNFLAGEAFENAVAFLGLCFRALRRFRNTTTIASLAAEVLERLPATHPRFAGVADAEAKANLALGYTSRALSRYDQLHRHFERLVQEKPDRPRYQRGLALSCNKIGSLLRSLGETERVGEFYYRALAIHQRLAEMEPDNVGYQRDLAVSYSRLGDLHSDLGETEQAGGWYQQSLAIRERLAGETADRADYQRSLSAIYIKLGDVHLRLGESDQASDYYRKALAIREGLSAQEPEHVANQRGLMAAQTRLGNLHRSLRQLEQAGECYRNAVALAEQVAASEPQRADYQCNLAQAYNLLGLTLNDLGENERAGEYHRKAMAIYERLVQAEPQRADYQRHLAATLYKVGTPEYLQSALAILESLYDSGRLVPRYVPAITELKKLLS